MSDSDHPPLDEGLASLGGGSSVSALLAPTWQEQDGVLRELWTQNKTPQEISEVLGRSVAAIMTRAARLGLPRRSAPGRKPGSRRIFRGEREQLFTRAPRSLIDLTSVSEKESTPQASTRICLMCLHAFESLGRHNRICPTCKGSSEYGAATSLADIHFPV